MAQYSLIAFFLLIVPFAFCFSNSNPKSKTMKTSFVICMMLLLFLAAFRGRTVGNDTHEYIRIFEEINYDYAWESRYEKGYLLLNILLYKICSNYQIIPIVTSCFILYSIGHFVWKYSKYPWLSVFIFFTNFFSFVTSGIRQSLAIAVLLWATDFLIRKKYWNFIILCLIAYSFHNSAILFLISLLFVKLNASWKLVFIYVIVGVAGSMLFSELLNLIFSLFSSYGNYVDGVYFEGEVRLASILYCLVSSVVVFVALRVKKNIGRIAVFEEDIVVDNLLIVFAMSAALIYFLSLKVNLLDRFALYFNIFTIVLIPNVLAMVPKRLRVAAILLTMVFFFTYNASIIMYRPNWSSLYPYRFFWSENNAFVLN